jgi:uncharacterized membrane protein
MAIGSVQLIALGFNHPEFHGEVIAELERLRNNDTVRVIDGLAVHKDAAGHMEMAHLSNMTRDDAVQAGTKIGAPLGLVIEGGEGMEPGAVGGRKPQAKRPPPSPTRRPGMSWRRFRTTPRQR